jgi:hypothetical protein
MRSRTSPLRCYGCQRDGGVKRDLVFQCTHPVVVGCPRQCSRCLLLLLKDGYCSACLHKMRKVEQEALLIHAVTDSMRTVLEDIDRRTHRVRECKVLILCLALVLVVSFSSRYFC